MKGSYHVRVSTRSLVYDFTIHRNITILQGDSATGKTTLVEMIREHETQGSDSAVTLICERPCTVIEGNTWRRQLRELEEESIVFIDEGSRFVNTEEFAAAAKNSRHYYVIVTRESLYQLPYSVTEIYGVRSSGKYNSLQPVFHEFYRLYLSETSAAESAKSADTVITEDSNAGYQFFSGILKDHIPCVPAGGNANILNQLKSFGRDSEHILVIADGAAFGAFMAQLVIHAARHKNVTLYLPESFEWLILCSGLIDGNSIQDILNHAEDYIESRDYFTWEQFFTALLVRESAGTFLRYQKAKLNPAYLDRREAEAIKRVLPMRVKEELKLI